MAHVPYSKAPAPQRWGVDAGGKTGRRSRLRRMLAAVTVTLLSLSATTAGLAAPHAAHLDASAPAAKASTPGTIVIDWNKTLLKILGTPGAQPATVHPTRPEKGIAVVVNKIKLTLNPPPELE